jgi:hypothetical protein
MTATLAGALAASGKEDETNALLAELEKTSRSCYVPQTALAVAHVLRRDLEQALSRLEKAFEERCFWLPYALMTDARFDSLRGEARFKHLVQRFTLGR